MNDVDPTLSADPFADASAGALADLQAPPAELPAETPADTPSEPTPPAEPENDLRFELKVKGQTHTLSRDEIVEYAQKGLDYTQKTQRLSEQERAVLANAQILQQRQQELEAFASDPARVRAWLQSQQVAAAEIDPDDIPTQAMMQAALARERQALDAQVAARMQELEQRLATREFESAVTEKRNQYAVELTQTIAGLSKTFSALDAYDAVDLDRALRADIAPKVQAEIDAFPDREVSLDRVKTLLKEAAKTRADRIEGKIQNHLKMAKVREAKLDRQGIEPRGGAPTEPASSGGKAPKLGTPEFLASVMADVQAAQRRD